MERGSRIDSLKSMLVNEPHDLFLNFALGLEYLTKSETIGLAEQQFKLVLNYDVNYLAAYYQLGKLLESSERKAQAIELFQQGLTIAKQQKNNKAVNEFSEAIFMLED